MCLSWFEFFDIDVCVFLCMRTYLSKYICGHHIYICITSVCIYIYICVRVHLYIYIYILHESYLLLWPRWEHRIRVPKDHITLRHKDPDVVYSIRYLVNNHKDPRNHDFCYPLLLGFEPACEIVFFTWSLSLRGLWGPDKSNMEVHWRPFWAQGSIVGSRLLPTTWPWIPTGLGLAAPLC